MDTQTNTTSTDTEPRTKESSVLDFTYLSLAELEEEVTNIFRNDEYAECSFHLDLLDALSFRLMIHGWKKDELLEFFTERVNDAKSLLVELEKEDEVKEVA